MENERSIENNVTKTFLYHCIDLKETSDMFSGISLDKLKAQKKDRDKWSSLGLRAKSLKVKVKLKIDNQYKYFAQKDEAGNFLVDESGRVVIRDYIEETIIYQKNGNIRLNLSKMAYELQECFWFSTISVLMKCKFENKCFKESYILRLIPKENTFEIEPRTRVDVSEFKDINISANDFCELIKIIEQLSSNSKFRIAAGGRSDSKDRPNKITNAGQWKNASDFQELELGISNCIYYLASENSDNGPAKMYIGEATVSGNRLCTRKIDGITYIGHRERPWEFTDYKFTRYRIDEVSTWDAMHDAQDAMIGSFFMSNYEEFPNGFVLTNNAFNKAYSSAISKKESRKNNMD